MAFVHRLIVLAYMGLPVGAVIWALYRAWGDRRRWQQATWGLAVLAMASVVIGVAASILYGVSLGGIVPVGQMALTSYFVAGLLCLLKLLDRGIFAALNSVLAVGKGTYLASQRRGLATVLRATLLFGIGLPYMVAAALTYHPRAIVAVDTEWAKMGATPIQFTSMDGLNLSGFWINAEKPPAGNQRRDWGQETVILCHGQTGNKASYKSVAEAFLASGYNVMTFDFRAYGQSEGQLVTFGVNERYDVLGAVRWLQINNPKASRKIHGIGMGTGGAALLAAAADPGPQGQEIDSLVVSGSYDRFGALADTAANEYFPEPLSWLTVHVGITLAGLQTGADLSHFSPAQAAQSVAPRPILFIHGRKDRIVRYNLGEDLFNAASAPKAFESIDDAEDDAINFPKAVESAKRFLDLAEPML